MLDRAFYLGICQLEIQQYLPARESFQAVIEHGQNLYLTQSAWYIGLTCLQLEDLDCVETHLSPIAAKPNAYQESAVEILEGLGR